MIKTMSYLDWRLTVDLEGGRIKELVYHNSSILGTYTRIDGKKGSTHVCVPNFFNEGTDSYGLPPHGPARHLVWNIRDDKKNYLTILCKIPATDKYQAELYIEQIFELDSGSFKQTVTVENGGDTAVPVNIGIHNYFRATEGWEGIKINGVDITKKVKSNGFVSLRHNNRIVFPDGLSYKLRVKNFVHGVLWSANENGVYDMSYLCIEPVRQYRKGFFGSKESLLPVGKTCSAMQEISL